MQRYNLTAEMYEERYSQEQIAKYKAVLENVDWSNSIALDAGCGTGLFFYQIAGNVKLTIGVDISHKLLARAKELTKIYGNTSVVQADVDFLPLREEFFTTVFAFTVFQNLPNPSKTLTELKRVTKVKGTMVVTGLKKAFPQTKFIDLIDKSGLQIASFIDNDDLKCYIAVLRNEQKENAFLN